MQHDIKCSPLESTAHPAGDFCGICVLAVNVSLLFGQTWSHALAMALKEDLQAKKRRLIWEIIIMHLGKSLSRKGGLSLQQLYGFKQMRRDYYRTSPLNSLQKVHKKLFCREVDCVLTR